MDQFYFFKDIGLEYIPQNIMGFLGLLTAIIVPLVIVLLIARFRSFLASIWALPTINGLIAFLLVTEQTKVFFEGENEFLMGFTLGSKAWSNIFMFFHASIMSWIANLINNEAVTNILVAPWMYFVPYVVLFIIFFLIFKIRRKSKRLIDEF